MRLSYKKGTVKLNLTQLDKWFEQCLKRILDDLKNPKCHLHGRQDYFTATDLVDCIRLTADEFAAKEQGEKLYRSEEPAGWWGYRGYSQNRLVIVDKPYRTDLLGLARSFLGYKVREGKLEGHNFGRGHCSGMRFRPKGSGLSETEEKTVKAKSKPYSDKPMHAMVGEPKGNRTLLCQKDRKRVGWSRGRSNARRTSDNSQVTCKRCLNLLKAQAEASTAVS